MDSTARTWLPRASIVGLVVLGVGVGLGSSSRLTYHEAFVAQAAREMLASRSLLVPTIDGRPWLEKPPLPFWLVAGSGWILGEVNAFSSRLSSAIAAVAVAGSPDWSRPRQAGW
jgi:4-amino-4-deoxy-L-arabinose transferase-like glycosyltransferase